MGQITLADVALVLRDMLGKRHGAMRKSTVATAIYEKPLRARLAEIDALPAALTGRPLADQLTAEDEVHDGYGRAIYYVTAAYLNLPTDDGALAAAAQAVRETFIPQLSDLNLSYPTEAATAHANESAIAAHKAHLKRIPVAGGTLGDWVQGFVESGKRIDALLSQRGDANSAVDPETRRKVGPLRSTTVGLLGRFRTALADEVAGNDQLPRNLEALVFGYYDELLRQRQGQGSARKSTPSTPDAPDAPSVLPTSDASSDAA